MVMSRKQSTSEYERGAAGSAFANNTSRSYQHSSALQQPNSERSRDGFDMHTQIPSRSRATAVAPSTLSSAPVAPDNDNANIPISENQTVQNQGPRRQPSRATHLPPHRSPSHDQIKLSQMTTSISGSTSMRPHNLTIPVHRTGSTPGSRKSSAASQDRDATGHLDLKRLLSKPAQHTTSSSSAVSLMSDSEISLSSQNIILPYLTTEPLRQPFNSGASSNHSPPVPVSASSSRSPSNRVPSRDASSSPGGVEKQIMRQSTNKPRNILRRRPSTRSTSAPASEPLKAESGGSKFHTRASSVKHRFRSIEALYPNHSRRSATSPRDASPLDPGPSRPKEGPRSPALTPAGAVVQAYKEQEHRREQLVSMAEWDDRVQHLSGNDKGTAHFEDIYKGRAANLNKTKSVDLSLHAQGSQSGAYYSVFGSTSGRLVAVGSPTDDSWVVSAPYTASAPNSATTVKSPAPEKAKSLTRKVSGRFKKVADSIKREKETPAAHRTMSESWRPYDGRPSVVHERRSETLPRGGKSGGHPLDEYIDVEDDRNSDRVRPTAKNSSPPVSVEKSFSPGHSASASNSAKGKKPGQEDTGGRWWKLVKRISTGALREMYRDPTPPPPVPALPANIHQHARASISGTIPSTSSHNTFRAPPSVPSMSSSSKSPKSPHSVSGTRPSIATRSSSPVSSEVASSGLFQPAASARSSTSSYGEELRSAPDCPDPYVGQHIMPPDELFRQAQEKKGRSASRSSLRAVRTKNSESRDDEHVLVAASMKPLPLPPQRSTAVSHEHGVSRDASPSLPMPSFSAAEPVNKFNFSDMFEFGVDSPSSTPVRPPKSERRKPASIHIPSGLVASSQPRTPRTPVTPRANTPSLVIDVMSPGRQSSSGPSSGSSTTAKRGPLSASTTTSRSSMLTSPKNRSPVAFRELESPRAAWSEKEKADKWEDLLRRSARAGGTLHIGESGLLSEELRSSDYSELSELSDS